MLLLMMLLMFPDDFKDVEEAWRAKREASMKANDSWLNLIGLYWLNEGDNTFGSSPDGDIVMPTHATVDRAGVITLKDGKVHFEMARAQRAMVDGESITEGDLDVGKVLTHNHLRMFLIERGGKLALRVRDLRARNFLEFKALDFYRPKKKYVVEGTFEPYDEPQKVTVATVINTEIELLVPGVIRFNLNGKDLELLPTLESENDDEFFIMLKDQTSGTTTYGGGRYFYVPRPVDGKVTLNFNRVINPPCGYTVYATCPMPPAENWLDIAIEAGERNYLEEAH